MYCQLQLVIFCLGLTPTCEIPRKQSLLDFGDSRFSVICVIAYISPYIAEFRGRPPKSLAKQAPTAVNFGIVANSTYHPPTYATKPNKCRHLLPYSRIRPIPVHHAHTPLLFKAAAMSQTTAHDPPPHDKASQMPIPTTLLFTTIKSG